MNQESRERTVFLSFTSLDREAARAVVAGLRAAGIDVWWDEGGIGWGDDWQAKLEAALSRCGAYVILLGHGGVRRWVKPELGVAFRRHVDDGLPILPLLLDGVTPESMPPFLSLRQARSLPADLAAFDFSALAAELRVASEATAAPALEGFPFPGLLPFDEDGAAFFLGRQADTLALLERLGRGVDGVQRRWLQVEGPSGVGKSSLVRAGLIPAVRAGWTEEIAAATWTVIVLRPGSQPLESLAVALERTLGGSAASATARAATILQRIEALRRPHGDDADLRYLLKVALPEGSRLLLVIDQFEELFTLTTDPQALARIDALLGAAIEDNDGPLFLVTTIRSDFLLRIGELTRLQGLLNTRAGRYDLRPLSLAGYREIVRIPAQRAGLRWSEPSLPERIVEDAIRGRSPLPLVANVLHLLWKAAVQRGDGLLRAEDYRALNGVAGALAKGGDRLLASLGPDARERARRLLLALVKPGTESQDTKRPISRAMALRAAGGGAAAEHVIRRLSGLRADGGPAVQDPDPRLIVISEAESDRPAEQSFRVDLAHEALLRLDPGGRPYWKTLRDWVDTWRKQLEDRDLLELLAEQWRAAGQPRLGGLASGRQLRDFRRVDAPSPRASAYLRASRLRRRLVGFAGAVGLALVAAVGGSYYMQVQRGLDVSTQLAWLALQVGQVYRPEMVTIPGGAFRMGCVSGMDCNDSELPVQALSIRAFAIGRHAVTFAEYAQFALSSGRAVPPDKGFGRGRRPVINVSWDDAMGYAAWLSERTGKRYRLPTEAEWEYAARAGTETRWSFGNDAGDLDTYAWYAGNAGGQTHPVGAKAPNPRGLYDVHGNVWEWVADCWQPNYQGAPLDGSAREAAAGDCAVRVLRGGSFSRQAADLRSASRDRGRTGDRGGAIGFRLAQNL